MGSRVYINVPIDTFLDSPLTPASDETGTRHRLVFRPIHGGSAMTLEISAFLLRRAYEHLTAGAGALVLTTLLLVTLNTAHAAAPRDVTPSVSILVPTVTIEQVN